MTFRITSEKGYIKMKISLAVLFGGKSVEHEISIISAIQAINNLDKNKYDIIPVYMTKSNEMYAGEKIGVISSYKNVPALLKESRKVTFINEGDKVYLTDHPFIKKFKKEKTLIDIIFPIVHGTNVEDGCLQGYIKTLGVPFVGCDVTASALGMDKYLMKLALKDAGIPVLDCVVINKFDYLSNSGDTIAKIKAASDYPVIVKPINLGSSIGIAKAKNDEELVEALETAFSYASRVLVERAVTDLREINCSVVGDSEEAEASECEEPLNATDILSYEDKYVGGNASKGVKGAKGAKSGSTDSQGMASLARKIPADISAERRAEIREMAVKAFKALGCNGVSRIDFMIDGKDDKVYVNEINTIPGSLSFYLWEPIGIPYEKLLDKMIQLSLKRAREEKDINYTFDTNVISLCNDGALGGAKK